MHDLLWMLDKIKAKLATWYYNFVALAIKHPNFVSLPKTLKKCKYLLWDTEAIKIIYLAGLERETIQNDLMPFSSSSFILHKQNGGRERNRVMSVVVAGILSASSAPLGSENWIAMLGNMWTSATVATVTAKMGRRRQWRRGWGGGDGEGLACGEPEVAHDNDVVVDVEQHEWVAREEDE